MVTKEVDVQKFAGMKRRECAQCLGDAGYEVEVFAFRGSFRGVSETGIPYEVGGYDTVANGWAECFYASDRKPGETVTHDGKTWTVARNGYSAGSPYFFASHSLVIFREKDGVAQ